MNALGHALDIVRVDEKRFAELGRCTGKLANDQCAWPIFLTRHILFGNEIHAIAQRRDQGHIGPPQQRTDLRKWQIAVHVLHGGPGGGAVYAVDFPNQLFHLAPEVLIGSHLLARWHRNLDERDALMPLFMSVQKALIGAQAGRDALGVVHAVHPQQELARSDAVVEPRQFVGRLRIVVDGVEKLLGSDADGIDAKIDLAATIRQVAGLRIETQDAVYGPQEILQITEGLKSHQVGPEKTAQ